jgi:hypothetical protein
MLTITTNSETLACAQALFGGHPWPVFGIGQRVRLGDSKQSGEVVGWKWTGSQWYYLVNGPISTLWYYEEDLKVFEGSYER